MRLEHDWVVIAVYNMNAERIRAFHSIGEKDTLRMDDLREEPKTVCMTCEQMLTAIPELDTECPGEPSGYNELGEPVWT